MFTGEAPTWSSLHVYRWGPDLELPAYLQSQKDGLTRATEGEEQQQQQQQEEEEEEEEKEEEEEEEK
ncbi:hypothetical protein ElyMa_006152100 [Elysia marginata]|uniref:Spondin domain-containing protein n=1 Tax=Elysia marginata TaxID=1093978 RepID=A0AAV4GYZ0_9GAST|nr:hypothetical protein ElyMa_006152100 [Elysia marginata]